MNCLFIDFGSTWIKYAVYCRESGSYHHKGSIAFPQRIHCDKADIFEVSVWEINNCIEKILMETARPSVDKIFISVQMHGYILKGEGWSTNYISWRDRRASALDLSLFDDDYTALGTSRKVNLPKIALNTFENIRDTEVQFFSLGSYIAWYLTVVNASHITDLAASGFYNVDTCLRGSDDFNKMRIPRALDSVVVVGRYKNADVYAPVGDHQLSFLGTGVGSDEYLLNISTATQISTLSTELSSAYECRPYFDNNRLCTVTGLIGGSYIREHQNEDIAISLIKNYSQALARLPKKKKIIVSGGGAQHFPSLITTVCKAMNTEFKIIDEVPIFRGFEYLVKRIVKL